MRMQDTYARIFYLMSAALLVLISGCVNGRAGSAEATAGAAGGPLSIQAFASNGPSGSSAYLLVGRTTAWLVDAAQTPEDGLRIATMIESAGKPLSTIFITHAHPDHRGALAALTQRFPTARVASIAPVAAALREQNISAEVLEASSVAIDGMPVEIVTFTGGESPVSAGLLIPALRTLISGDVVYNQTHPFLGNKDLDAWRAQLARIEGMHLAAIYPGHGAPVAPTVLDSLRTYFDVFVEASSSGNRAAAERLLRSRYPQYRGDNLLNFSLSAYLGAAAQ